MEAAGNKTNTSERVPLADVTAAGSQNSMAVKITPPVKTVCSIK
jgi:hypothetical protein